MNREKRKAYTEEKLDAGRTETRKEKGLAIQRRERDCSWQRSKGRWRPGHKTPFRGLLGGSGVAGPHTHTPTGQIT